MGLRSKPEVGRGRRELLTPWKVREFGSFKLPMAHSVSLSVVCGIKQVE